LDVPQGTEFGIDCHSWHVGALFKGVKLIPFGIHLVFFSQAKDAPRISFFLNFTPTNKVIVKRWNPRDEDFFDTMDSDEVSRYTQGVENFDFDSGLGSYPFQVYQNWCQLTSFITNQTICRLQPSNELINSSSKPMSAEDSLLFKTSLSENQNSTTDAYLSRFSEGIPMDEEDEKAFYKVHAQKLSEKQNFNSRPCKYNHIPQRIWNPNLTGDQITKLNFDKSESLEILITHCGSKTEVLGELQFAFVTFLMGQSYESFEHWKQILCILCRAQKSIESDQFQEFYLSFIVTLQNQISLIPEDFFSDIIGENNFLVPILKDFFDLLDLDAKQQSPLRTSGKTFRRNIEQTFSVSFLEEADEDTPVVVDTQEMLQLGLSPQEIQKILFNDDSAFC